MCSKCPRILMQDLKGSSYPLTDPESVHEGAKYIDSRVWTETPLVFLTHKRFLVDFKGGLNPPLFTSTPSSSVNPSSPVRSMGSYGNKVEGSTWWRDPSTSILVLA